MSRQAVGTMKPQPRSALIVRDRRGLGFAQVPAASIPTTGCPRRRYRGAGRTALQKSGDDPEAARASMDQLVKVTIFSYECRSTSDPQPGLRQTHAEDHRSAILRRQRKPPGSVLVSIDAIAAGSGSGPLALSLCRAVRRPARKLRGSQARRTIIRPACRLPAGAWSIAEETGLPASSLPCSSFTCTITPKMAQ